MSSALKEKIIKTRSKFKFTLDQIFLKSKQKEELFEKLEELLILADVGWETTQKILNSVKVKLKDHFTIEKGKEILEKEILNILNKRENKINLGISKTVIILVGTNGSGKTTCTAKLANYFKRKNKKTMMVAGDTFRPAAVEQLLVWGKKLGVPVFKNLNAKDPASVVFDALDAKEIDIFLIDTAGRLHTKINLMLELEKISRVASRKISGAPHEVLLVIDAGFGHNAIFQAKEFLKFSKVTGLFIAKLDGTAKAGSIIGISDELNLPVKFIGTGEGEDDIFEFSPKDYVEALLL